MAPSSSPEVSTGSVEENAAVACPSVNVLTVVTDEEETKSNVTRSFDAVPARADGKAGNEEAKEEDHEQDNDDEGEEKKDEATVQKKVDYSDWPLKGIREPHANDVLFGRGGGTNHHPGNKRYRKMVEDRKVDYINSKRLDKPLVALDIIKVWRGQEPPGRFLKIDEKTGLWSDVGDKKAREKTSQALREKAPIIRKQQEEETKAKERRDNGLPESDEEMEALNDAAPDRPKPVMARDTTFGVEYVDDQPVTLDGFSWQDGINASQRSTSRSTPPAQPTLQYPPSREGSYSSGLPVPGYRYGSHGGMPPPPQSSGSFSTPSTSGVVDRAYQFTGHGRFESWSSIPPPPPGPGYIRPQASWSDRDHSLGNFPLPHASIGQAASYTTFDPRSVSGVYGPPPPPPPYYPPTYSYSGGPPPPPPPPPAHAGPGSHPPSYGPPPPRSPSTSSPSPRPPYSFDPSVASTWSGQSEGEIIKTLSGEEGERVNASPRLNHAMLGVKPDIVKRVTSNQCETLETKPDLVGGQVKRAALNRDSSNAANRLKELCFPGQFKNGRFDAAREMNELNEDFGRSTLVSQEGVPSPDGVSRKRTSTADLMPPIQGSISEDSVPTIPPPVKPSLLESRTTTMDAIAASLEDDYVEITRVESVGLTDLPKPGVFGYSDRLTTTDLMQMVNEPIPDDDPELTSGKRQAL